MPLFKIGPDDAIYYEYTAPASPDGKTLVFFNALTGSTEAWESVIGPGVRKAGHGTLTFNFRGQADSPFSPDLTLDDALISDDATALMAHVNPVRPVMVGLSIGGLFAARAYLGGAAADAMILINTLRKNTARLKWIGDALVRAAEVGGLDLFKDLYMPLLTNEAWIGQNRPAFLKTDQTYASIDKKSGIYKLLSEAGTLSNWDLPYEQLDLPVLVVTGLQDHVFLESDAVDALFKRLPQARRVDMAQAGHLIPMECPEDLCGILIDFLKEL